VDAGQVDGNDTAGHVDDVMRPSTGEGGDPECETMCFSIFYIKIVFLLLFLSTRFDKFHQRTFLYSSGAGSYRSPIPTYQSPDIPTCLLQVL